MQQRFRIVFFGRGSQGQDQGSCSSASDCGSSGTFVMTSVRVRGDSKSAIFRYESERCNKVRFSLF
jgi:hypothetical protein